MMTQKSPGNSSRQHQARELRIDGHNYVGTAAIIGVTIKETYDMVRHELACRQIERNSEEMRRLQVERPLALHDLPGQMPDSWAIGSALKTQYVRTPGATCRHSTTRGEPHRVSH